MKRKNIFVLIVTAVFLIIAFLSFIDDIAYSISKKETKAQITKLEKLNSPNPYKAYIVYYNSYERSFERTYINDIEGSYGEKLKVFNKKNIFYRKYFPTEVYFVDYKSPNYGQLFLSFVFLLIMLLGVIALIKE